MMTEGGKYLPMHYQLAIQLQEAIITTDKVTLWNLHFKPAMQ
jgi:hypothetical protein